MSRPTVKRHRKKLGSLAIALVLAFLFWHTFWASPMPPPAAISDPIPSASPPPEMTLQHFSTGVTHRNAAVAYRGGKFSDARDFSMAAALVHHPKGDILIDTGLGRTIDAQFAALPFWFRWATSFSKGTPAADQLPVKPTAILLTHAHWDHVSGVPDFPDTPIWVTAEERRFIDEGGWISATARNCTNAKWQEYGFEGGPYLGFPKSHDVFGDGAVVVVPQPGHTPGSVIVFVTLPSGKRYAFVGDLAWQSEGITEREERPWLIRSMADLDASGVRDGLLHMAAIKAKIPDLALVPAHDARAFADMP
jgi:glyoxylase-like metal-dependent hydrolase (beta-lactamase superfamily II)